MSEAVVKIPEPMRVSLEEEAARTGVSVETLAQEAIALLLETRRTQAHFAKLRAEADITVLDKVLNREGGEPPIPGDELPQGYLRTF